MNICFMVMFTELPDGDDKHLSAIVIYCPVYFYIAYAWVLFFVQTPNIEGCQEALCFLIVHQSIHPNNGNNDKKKKKKNNNNNNNSVFI